MGLDATLNIVASIPAIGKYGSGWGAFQFWGELAVLCHCEPRSGEAISVRRV